MSLSLALSGSPVVIPGEGHLCNSSNSTCRITRPGYTSLVHCACATAKMTKDWDAVQDEIKELSFIQKKPLEEVKELMERKYKFVAS